MKTDTARDEHSDMPTRQIQNNGLLYGSLLGVFLGVIISGPHFNEWSIWEILATSGLFGVTIGLMGYLGVVLFCSALAEGPGFAEENTEDDFAVSADCRSNEE